MEKETVNIFYSFQTQTDTIRSGNLSTEKIMSERFNQSLGEEGRVTRDCPAYICQSKF